MNLKDFYKKVDYIEKTNPAPKELHFPETNFFYRKIIKRWMLELSKKDVMIVNEIDKSFG